MTTIRYFVPEDGDDESHPNVFLAPKARQPGYPPTLAEVKHSFPLPGRYHFRFKAPLIPGSDRDKGSMAVWMDCTDDRQHVPTWKSAIVAKVTRIGIEEDEEDDDADFARGSAPAATPAPRQTQESPSLDIFGGGSGSASFGNGPSPTSVGSNPPPTSVAPSMSNGGSLLDGHGPTPVTAASKDNSSSLLDMNGPVYTHPAPRSAHADFFGMTTPPVSGNKPTSSAYASASTTSTSSSQYGGAQQRPMQTHPPPVRTSSNSNAFNSFSQQSGPFGDLGTPWK